MSVVNLYFIQSEGMKRVYPYNNELPKIYNSLDKCKLLKHSPEQLGFFSSGLHRQKIEISDVIEGAAA